MRISDWSSDMCSSDLSLEKLLERDERIYYPTHGAPVDNPRRLVRGMLTHRKQREYQIVALLKEGVKHIPDMVARMYVGLDPRLTGGAGRRTGEHRSELQSLIRTSYAVICLEKKTHRTTMNNI